MYMYMYITCMHTLSVTRTHSCQVACVLNSIVLFDTLSLDFEIAEVVFVSYGGQMRSLSSFTTPQEGVAWQLNQRLSPPEKLHVKVYHVLHCLMIVYMTPFPRCFEYKGFQGVLCMRARWPDLSCIKKSTTAIDLEI